MADTVPPDRRIDRAGLERIIQRAAELQARDREIGEGLTPNEVLQLGTEVGISNVHLQQALVEEQTRALVRADKGLGTWLTGPRHAAAERILRRPAAAVEEALAFWMSDGELLSVKRRYPDSTAWEARRGAMAALKRSLGTGGRRYVVAGAHQIVTRVAPLDTRRTHVRIVADLSNTRREHLGGAAGMGITGAGLSVVALILGVVMPVALIPAPAGLVMGYFIARSRRAELEKMQTALEQILDRLEHDEIQVPNQAERATHPLARIADEIRRQLAD